MLEELDCADDTNLLFNNVPLTAMPAELEFANEIRQLTNKTGTRTVLRKNAIECLEYHRWPKLSV